MLIIYIALGIVLGWMLIQALPAVFDFVEQHWKALLYTFLGIIFIVIGYGLGYVDFMNTLIGLVLFIPVFLAICKGFVEGINDKNLWKRNSGTKTGEKK
jgi:hypothetical protein